MGQRFCLTKETLAGIYILLWVLSELLFTLNAVAKRGLGVVEWLLTNLFNSQVFAMFTGEQAWRRLLGFFILNGQRGSVGTI